MSPKKKKRAKEIIRMMMGKGTITLSEITQNTNMSLPVATDVVQDLCKMEKLIEVNDIEATGLGRPPVMYKLNPKAGYTIGIDLGRVSTNIIVLDFSQKQIYEKHFHSILSLSTKEAIERIEVEIKTLLDDLKIVKKDLLGIGIALPGLVKGKEGRSNTYLKVKGDTLKNYLEKKLDITIRIEHDVKSMTYGELYYGSLQNQESALFINYGWGLGLGIIIDNKVYYGNDGYSGEFGHIHMVPNGELCYCGKQGCLETLSSGRAIVKKIKEKLNTGSSSMLRSFKPNIDEIDLNDILKASNNGDIFSIEILDEASKYLGIGIAQLINIFNPKLITIGGMFAQVAHYLLDSLKNNAIKHSLIQLNENLEFGISELHNNVASLGVGRLTSIENCANFLE